MVYSNVCKIKLFYSIVSVCVWLLFVSSLSCCCRVMEALYVLKTFAVRPGIRELRCLFIMVVWHRKENRKEEDKERHISTWMWSRTNTASALNHSASRMKACSLTTRWHYGIVWRQCSKHLWYTITNKTHKNYRHKGQSRSSENKIDVFVLKNSK